MVGSIRASFPVALALCVGLGATRCGEAQPAQPRPHGTRVVVPPAAIRVMDGDTAEIRWSAADTETVRVLGIDTAELFGRKGRTPMPHPGFDWRGVEARGFARGAFATPDRIELLRCATRDRYRRTLGYFFLDGRNYSVLVIEAGLSRETISRYGDNGLPDEARAVLEAAKRSPTPPRTTDFMDSPLPSHRSPRR